MRSLLFIYLLLFVAVSSLRAESGVRIMGGYTAQDNFAPYQVSLQTISQHKHFCGGAILDGRYILTAGHCLFDKKGTKLQKEDIVIATGTNEWKKPDAKYYIEEFNIHCEYNKPENHNDIAILRLKDSIAWKKSTQPIKLASQAMKAGASVILTGWGLIQDFGPASDKLQKITLFNVPNGECKKKLTTWSHLLGDGHFCTYKGIDEGPCHGDSGSPLVQDNYLVGIANFVHSGDCANGYPDAHASVLYYTNWINGIMSKDPKVCKL